MLLIGLIFSLRYPAVQTYFAKKAAGFLAKELQTTVTLDGLYFRPFSSLSLKGLYIADLDGDTLLYADRLVASVDLWKLRDRQVVLKQLSLSDSHFTLKRDADSTNLSFIINYFRPANKRKPSSNRVTVDINTVNLSNGSFSYRRSNARKTVSGINFGDIQLTGINGQLSNLYFTQHLFKSTIKNLHFREKSGFLLRRMDALAVVDTNSITLQNLNIETNQSRLRDYLRLDYRNFSAFASFVDSVAIDLNVKQSSIHSNDIAFFAPSIANIRFDAKLSGAFTGKVRSFKANHVTLQTGNNTQLQGDFTVIGLPSIEHTIFDMHLNRLVTDASDIELLVSQLNSSQTLHLPESFDHLGTFTYRGTFHGRYYDFNAIGVLETDLGTTEADVQLAIRNGGSYIGQFTTADFDIGTLFQYPDLGHSGFHLTVDGQGFALRDISGNVEGAIDYLDFRGYRYTNTKLKGTMATMQLAGNISVNDPNLRLNVQGDIGLDPESPEYAVDGEVSHANLPLLFRFGQEQASVIVDHAIVAVDLSGNTWNHLQGNVRFHDILLQVDSGSHTIDSLILTATGNEDSRHLQLHSDLADATVTGQVDLSALDDYFKSIVMQYAPSLRLATGELGVQTFDVRLNLKNITPIAALWTPHLRIPEGASLNARFSTLDNANTITFLANKLSYGDIQAQRLIIDESAHSDDLRLLITADRLSAGDSLYVDNVNISTILARDSLHFNLKLSDFTTSNQLDLNGLAHFKQDAPAHISLLPSAIVLNGEPWKLDERATFLWDKNRLDVNGFELSNKQQAIQLQGVLSAVAEDQAALTFRNFNLNTLNAIIQHSGLSLNGTVNGRMNISSVFKNPYALADLTAEDVRFNETEIGKVLLLADFDRASELVNVRLEITKDEINTLIATGTYDAAAESDKLNVKARLNNNELLLFQPFLSKLVSNVSGTVSADLRIAGSILTPKIDGLCQLHDAAFTVNYLNTAYRINDEVALSNSTITLKDLVITDPKNNRAIANGQIDMRNPITPIINVSVEAANFLALNTTLKNNPLYYGTAYATGTFAFNGPTNAMNINIQARTNENTSFHIPLNAVGTVSDNDFIHFVSRDTLDAERPQSRLFEGLSMNMDVQITPEAETSLYTDLGELSGRGEGAISLRISSLGDFEMFGDYTINTGKFTFTAQDFINKIFDINPGGTIRWTGQPADATVNLTAVYGQRTSLGPLYNAAGRETVEQRVLAQAEMNLNGSLMRPDITFALSFPNDPYVKDELQSYLSDANNVNQQALSLIARRSFTPGGASTDFSRELNNTLLSAGTELAFNQLNNLISQSLNLNFVDLNIRSLNDASASVRLFNDRVIFTGGVTDRRNLNDLNLFSDRVVTDAELLYLIRKDGRLILRGSNRLNSRNFLPLTINENYVSAIGLVYRQEFYTFQEFFRRLTTLRTKTEDEEGKDDEDKDSQDSP